MPVRAAIAMAAFFRMSGMAAAALMAAETVLVMLSLLQLMILVHGTFIMRMRLVFTTFTLVALPIDVIGAVAVVVPIYGAIAVVVAVSITAAVAATVTSSTIARTGVEELRTGDEREREDKNSKYSQEGFHEWRMIND